MEFPATKRPRIFVHLAHGFGARNWQSRWHRGAIIGLNDHLPYGYFWAEQDGCTVEYCEDRQESLGGKGLRLICRLVLGFDFVHAWRNRRGILAADVVWTHNESQHLAVLLLLRMRGKPRRPKIIAQSVWLFDVWSSLSPLHRWLFATLMARADLLTVLSPENLKLARRLFPGHRSELVLFGVRAEQMIPRLPRPAHQPIRILSLGNDRHRDWATLIKAVQNWPECELRLVTPRINRALFSRAPNAALVKPADNDELAALYDWADLVVVPLLPNLHASGITVVLEATVFGLPVICSDTGGLRAYFSDTEVRFVPPGDPEAIRRAILMLAEDTIKCAAMVGRARGRILTAGLTSRDYAKRHAELSRELLR